MYEAEGDKVYVNLVERQLFLTVHPTDTGGTMTVEEQAVVVAKLLNGAMAVS